MIPRPAAPGNHKEMLMTIKPTNGRIVWYTPCPSDPFNSNNGVPLAAIVTHVWNDTLVNLCVFDPNGFSHGVTSVPLIQEGDPNNHTNRYCEWMPYQKGQAAKTEAAEAKLAAA